MKKPKLFLLFLLSLMLSVTAWADEIQVSTNKSTPEHVYAIHGGPKNQSVYWGSLGGNVGVNSAAFFAFYSSGNTNEYYIYNVTDKKYLSYDQSSIENGQNKVISADTDTDAKPWKITAISTSSEYFQMQPITTENEAAIIYANWKGGVENTTHTSMGLWEDDGSTDGGSAWKLEVAEDYTCTLTAEDNTTVTYTKKATKGKTIYWQWDGSLSDIINLTDEKWGDDNSTYTANIKTSAKKYMYGSPSGKICYIYASGTAVKTQLNYLPTNETYKNWEWQFVPTFDSETLCFKIKNMNEGKYIVTSSASLTLGEESSATKYVYGSVNGGYGFSDKSNTNVYISVGSSTAGEKNAEAWTKANTTHKGVNLTFVTPTDFDALMTDLKTAKEAADKIELSTELGKYCATTTFTTAKTDAASVIAETKYLTASEFKTLISKLSTSALTVNVPQSGKYYTFKCVKGNRYILSTLSAATNMKDRLATSAENADVTADCIFYFNESSLVGYNNGYYISKNSSGSGFPGHKDAGSTSGTTFTFVSGNVSEGSLCINFENNTRGVYGAKDGYIDAQGANSTTEEACRFIVTEVTELPLTIGANGWSSFSAPVAVSVPNEVKAYYAPNDPAENKLVLEEITNGIIPANTGVVIKGTEGATVNFSTNITGTATDLSNNKLVCNWCANKIGTGESTNTTDGLYAFATKTNSATGAKTTGFMKLLTKITLPGHKCYLNAATAISPSTGSAQFIPISLTDDPTGIESAETTTVSGSDAPVYDLQGRKVNGTKKGGMYIQNGKVFIAM